MVNGVLKTLEELTSEAEVLGLDIDTFLDSVGAELQDVDEDFQEGVVDNVDATVTPKAPEASETPSTMEQVLDVGSLGSSLINPILGISNLFRLAKKYDKGEEGDFSVTEELKDIPQRVWASTLSVGETLSNVPGWLNRLQFNIAKSFADEEFQEEFDKMSAQEQDDLVQNISSATAAGIPGVGGFIPALGKPGREKAAELKASAEKWREDLEKYDKTIFQAFAQGQVIEGVTRTFAGAMETIPSIAQAMIPYVGIGSIVAGQAAQADAENIEKGEKLNTKNLIYSTIIGASEGLLEITTKKIGGKMFKDLAGKSKEYVKQTLKGVTLKLSKEAGSEGLSESATLTINKAADMLIMGNKKAFENYWLELADTFIIGAATGGGMSGTGTAGTIIRDAQANNSMRRSIENSQYNSVFEAFDGTEITDDKIKLAK